MCVGSVMGRSRGGGTGVGRVAVVVVSPASGRFLTASGTTTTAPHASGR